MSKICISPTPPMNLSLENWVSGFIGTQLLSGGQIFFPKVVKMAICQGTCPGLATSLVAIERARQDKVDHIVH